MFELKEEDQCSPMAQVQDNNILKLSKKLSFNQDTIDQWNTLQESLQLQCNLLTKENETKNERIQSILSAVDKYYQTQLRYKDIRRLYTTQQHQNYTQKQCLLGYKFEGLQNDIQKFIFLIMDNQELLSSILHSSLDIGNHNLDEFVYDILTFLYDPVVGAGLQDGVFKFLSELLKLELENIKEPINLFSDKHNLVCKFLIGFTKGSLCQSYIQQVCGQAMNLLFNVKEELELNQRTLYENQLRIKDSKESAQHKKIKQDDKKRKNLLSKISQLVWSSDQQTSENIPNVYETLHKVNVPENLLNTIIQQITPAIQSVCQTPLNRVVDPQLVEECARILYDRRIVVQMIINSINENILHSLHKLPFIIRALCRLQYQIFKYSRQDLSQKELFQLLVQFLINKWLIPEFTSMLLNQQQLEQQQFQLNNITRICNILIGVWKQEQFDGLNIGLTQSAITSYFTDLIELPTTQLNYYLRDKQDNQFASYMLSIADLQILLNTVSKSRIEGSLCGIQLEKYKIMRDMSDSLLRYSSTTTDFMGQFVINKNQKVSVLNMHFSVYKFSELYSVNYVDTAIKFQRCDDDLNKEEQMFVAKAKQVVAQFLICIERISLLRKLRHKEVLSFDNLIYMYKDSYENKTQILKQYENISPQLYANYLLSIYKMIPQRYTSNNLNQLCCEMREEFQQKLQYAKEQQQAMVEAYLRIITQLQAQRYETKQFNKMLKMQELQKRLSYFLKNVKIPILLMFKFGQVNLITLTDTAKMKTLDPKDQEKQQFLQILNSADLKTVQLELPFQNVRDFIDIISGLKHLELALNGDQVNIEICSRLFQQFMHLIEERLEQQSFFVMRDYYKIKCYENIEKMIVRRILVKYFTIHQIIEDQQFIDNCIKKQKCEMLPEVLKCMSEYTILRKMSEQLRLIDNLMTPLEKLDVIRDTQNDITQMLSISGIEDNVGQDIMLPLFNYLIIQACPKYTNTSLNILQTLFNIKRWKYTEYDYALAQFSSGIQIISQQQ